MKNMKRILALALVIVSVMAVAAPALAASTMYVTVPQGRGYYVNLRASQSTSSSVLAKPTYGSAITVNSSGSTWSSVSYYDPVTKNTSNGYIQSQYLTSSIPTDCYWILQYGTIDHRYTNSEKTGCDILQGDLNDYFQFYGSTSYSWYPLVEDGICGNNTVNAIRQFQRENNLTVDGIAGNRTKEYLYKILYLR